MKQIKITQIAMDEALTQVDTLEELSRKNIGCLRLLTEEMFSLCKELLHVELMDFEVRSDSGCYTLCVTTQTKVGEGAREQFLSISSSGKNAASKGVKGMLGAVLDALFHEGDPAIYSTAWAQGMHAPSNDYACMWTLSQYMRTTPQDLVNASWDGMEKSIIANFSDDVSIGVRSGRLEMTVTKAF